jgi:hypothetical protein
MIAKTTSTISVERESPASIRIKIDRDVPCRTHGVHKTHRELWLTNDEAAEVMAKAGELLEAKP